MFILSPRSFFLCERNHFPATYTIFCILCNFKYCWVDCKTEKGIHTNYEKNQRESCSVYWLIKKNLGQYDSTAWQSITFNKHKVYANETIAFKGLLNCPCGVLCGKGYRSSAVCTSIILLIYNAIIWQLEYEPLIQLKYSIFFWTQPLLLLPKKIAMTRFGCRTCSRIYKQENHDICLMPAIHIITSTT